MNNINTEKIKAIILFLFTFSIAVFPSLDVTAAEQSTKWRLVKSVLRQSGGTQDFILIPEYKQTDLDYYHQIADAVCGKRVRCEVYYWTNEKYIPSSEWFDGPAMQSLTGQYERSPNYQEPHLRLACWLYPSMEIAKKMNCFTMPGAKVPPSK